MQIRPPHHHPHRLPRREPGTVLATCVLVGTRDQRDLLVLEGVGTKDLGGP
jgi:hypothetical protein